jgi:glycosyltransferase involved in cell wall biosynthesis
MKRTLLYFHDGKSVYDDFFLSFLRGKYDVHFATFSEVGADRMSRRGMPHVHYLRDLPVELRFHDTIRGLALTPLRVPLFAVEVAKLDPDVVLACWATTYGFYAAASGTRPFGLMVWGSDVLIQPRYPPLKAFASASVKAAKRVFLDSQVQARAAMGLGCPPSSIVEFPWVDLSYLRGLHPDPEGVREELGVGRDSLLVMFNRRHDWVYSPETYVDAAAAVLRQEPSVVFLMAGEGSLTPAVKERVRSLGIGESFRFLGWLDRLALARYTASSDIYVTCSVSDGTSASLLEAMALGIPPVVSDIPGNLEWVTVGRTGLVFGAGDSAALAKCILELVKDAPLRRRLGSGAREEVEERADWAKCSQLLLKGLEDIQRSP